MKFIDETIILVKAGNGGNGCLSFRREKYIPFGGPDGGDGGKGGDIFFRVNQNKNTLIDFQNKRVFLAKNGRPGAGKNKSGSAAEDLIIDIPKGTVIYDDISGDELLDCCDEDASYLIAKGGDGGQGNARFKSSTNQAPRKFTLGFEGEVRFIRLELKSLADVGLVGFPNAGKSTLLNTITNAHPKMGAYPFTTLFPTVGILEYPEIYERITLADIPGLIEGASENKGLGHRFLKHIERCKVIVIMVDMQGTDNRDPLGDYRILVNELKLYKPQLLKKPMVVVGNKMDEPDAEKNFKKISNKLKVPTKLS